MNGCIIPEENEKSINPQQENAIFLVMGDEAYTDEMIDEYNRNAEAKTEEFNTNATNKLNAFNENATTKTNAFNTNATTQTDTYNSNAATKLSEYNDNAAAKEQSYNSNADTKTQAFNQNAAQKEYEFNQNALAYQEGIEKNAEEIDEVSNRVYRIENNLYDSGTAEGYFINIEDSSYSEFQNVSVDGVCEQVTTTGKNLLPYPYAETTLTRNGITYTVNDNGSVLLNGTATSDTSLTLFGSIAESSIDDIPGDYVTGGTSDVHVRIVSRLNSEYHLIADNTSGFTKIDKSVYTKGYVEIKITAGKTFNNVTIYPMLSNEANIDWEPYTGGQPSPSPDYPQDIKTIEEGFNLITCGQNLYNVNDKYTGGINSYNSAYSVDEDGWVTLNIENEPSDVAYYNLFTNNLNLKPDTYYNVVVEIKQKSGLGTLSIVTSRKEDNVQVEGQFVDNFSNTFGNFSPGIYVKKLKTLNKEQLDNTMAGLRSYIMLNKGAYSSITFRISVIEDISVTSDTFIYEPYQSLKTTITLPEGQFAAKINDTVKDQFRIAYDESDGNYHLYLDKNVSKTILDGSENWSLYSQNPNRFVLNTPSSYINMKSSTYNTICDHYKYDASGSNYPCYATGETYAIQIYDNQFTTVDDLKAWLQSNNVAVYYQPANPQTIDIGKVQMPLTYYPVTNVFTDCPLLPTIEVAYYRDFKTTIEAMQKDIASNTSRIETLEEQLQSQATIISNLENRVTALEPTQTESEVVEQ